MIPSTPGVFEGVVRHQRLTQVRHGFAKKVMLGYIDVDAPEQLNALRWWSADRRTLIRMHNADFLDGADAPLGPRVRDLVAQRLGHRPDGPVHLLANLRTAGWLMNPLSAYYCWNTDASLAALVLEVTNTPWRQRHWYVLDGGPGTAIQAKALHVSPFFGMNQDYRFRFSPPGDGLDLSIQVRQSDATVFVATLSGTLSTLTPANSRRIALRHPLMPLQVSAGIYAHAGVLLLKGAKYHRNTNKAPSTLLTGGAS